MNMKKQMLSIVFTIVITMSLAVNSSAYTFPTPDWGKLLKEREKMVNEVDFELYTEGDINSAPYYGAKFEPKGGTYIGMIAEHSDQYQPLGSYLTYVEGMSQPDLYYPANNMVKSDNVITMVGWTITDMNSVDYNQVRSVFDRLSTYNKPMFIRFANEMNTGTNGDNPDKYKEVFRVVADMAHEYDNFATVWSPIDIGALDRNYEYYYPGDEYVDWVGLSCYSIKYFLGNKNTSYKDSVYFMTGDYAWATNRVKPFMEFLEKNNINKPVMLSECGVATSNKHGENLEAWNTPRLKNLLYSLIMNYPQIKMINYFNVWRGENENFNLYEHPYAENIFKEAANNGAYIRQYAGSPDFVYRKASDGETLVADSNGVVPLYVSAYIPKQPEIAVNYELDGVWYHSSKSIPYRCNFNINDMADGKHTLKIYALNQSKSYTLYKRGRCIRFGGEPDIAAQSGIKVVLNKSEVMFEQPPEIINERTMVPMRAIFEALGAEVNWNGDTRIINANRSGKYISMQIENSTMYIDGRGVELDSPPILINDYTMVPVRAVSEALDCSVSWDGETRTVYITHN